MDVFKLIEKHGIELHGEIEYFAELIRQDEREACAKVCEDIGEESDAFTRDILRSTAATIRARNNNA